MGAIDLKITLQDIKPPIWRQIRISSKASLLDLHYVIQQAFGWTNRHLFIFEVGSMEFVDSDTWEEDAYQFQSAMLAKLDDLIPKRIPIGGVFSYVYDMGDNWKHEILVEGVDETAQTFSGAICMAAERAGPPEDVGSVPGYVLLLENLQHPGSPAYKRAVAWLGYDYDPESANSLDEINQSLRDYFKTTKLKEDTYWAKRLPLHNPGFDFINDWIRNLSPEHRQYAKSLEFRRDVVSLLTYLKDHKVKGTKATGNFPRRDIRAIAARFEHPLRLDQQFGDLVYELRTEDEVPELIFMHNFLNAAGLILGGENMLWELTSLGERFLASAPEAQAWYLSKFWFYQFNWEFSYPFTDAELSGDIFSFRYDYLKLLCNYPSGKQVEIKRVIQDLDRILPGWIHVEKRFDITGSTKQRFFVAVLVKNFAKFGFFEVIKTKDDPLDFDYYSYYTHIIITDYGKSLMRYLQKFA